MEPCQCACTSAIAVDSPAWNAFNKSFACFLNWLRLGLAGSLRASGERWGWDMMTSFGPFRPVLPVVRSFGRKEDHHEGVLKQHVVRRAQPFPRTGGARCARLYTTTGTPVSTAPL